MAAGVQLFIVRGAEEVPALTLGGSQLYVGRSADSHLVFPDVTVSSRHAAFWVEGGRIWVRDCGSRNGTFVNDKAVNGASVLHEGDRIRLGTSSALIVRGTPESPQAPIVMARMLEDVDAGVRYPLVGDRFAIGTSDLADLRLDADAEDEALLSVHPDGEIWMTTFESEGPLEEGEAFSVGGRTFRVVPAGVSFTATLDASPMKFPYRIEVTLDGVVGAEAVLTDPRSDRRYVVEAENRAVLLYLLAKQAHGSRKGDNLESWCSDEDVAVGVWGKRGTSDTNSLHVLVHRLRKELKKAGFDPWFIEKRRKAIRLALDDVTVN